jgi:lysophospholipase L1-like esterase
LVILRSSICLVLVGCATVPSAATRPAKADNPLKIVAFGDSTTAPREGLKSPYSQVLSDELPRRGVPATIINAGVPGNNTTQALARLQTDVLAHKPDVVIIQFGINDGMIDVWKDPPATVSRVSKHDFEENLHEFVRQIRAGGGKVLLMTPNPLRWVPFLRELYGKPPYKLDDPAGLTFILAEYAQIVRDVARAEKVPLVDVYSAFEEYGKQPGHSVDELLPDGVHPNDAGHRIVAEMLMGKITADRTAER